MRQGGLLSHNLKRAKLWDNSAIQADAEDTKEQSREAPLEDLRPGLKDLLLAPTPRGDFPVPKRGALRLRKPLLL